MASLNFINIVNFRGACAGFRRALPLGSRLRAPREKSIGSNVLRLSASFAFLLLAAAVPAASAAAPAPTAPEKFFLGRTEGSGTVSMTLAGSHKVRDVSTGRLDKTGALLLDQMVYEEGKPARRRSWRLARAGGNRIAGTISDAIGPVTGDIRGNVLHLKYQAKEASAQVEQWITLHPNGRTATNRMVFRKFGFKAATLTSTIRKLD